MADAVVGHEKFASLALAFQRLTKTTNPFLSGDSAQEPRADLHQGRGESHPRERGRPLTLLIFYMYPDGPVVAKAKKAKEVIVLHTYLGTEAG